MSTPVAYDPSLFLLERAEVVSARLGELILGESMLGTEASAWVSINNYARFSMTLGYNVDDNGTLIVEADTASVSISYWDNLPGEILYPLDRVRASYDGAVIFLGTVDTTGITYEVTEEAKKHGASRRVTFTASLVGTYAAALLKSVCWTALPAESPIDRIQRWVTVSGWED